MLLENILQDRSIVTCNWTKQIRENPKEMGGGRQCLLWGVVSDLDTRDQVLFEEIKNACFEHNEIKEK